MLDMRRRAFITLLGGAAVSPLAARAQQTAGKTVSVGILALEELSPIDTFRQALNDLGYVEGKNVRFEHRYAKGRNERFPELANDLIGPQSRYHSHLGYRGRTRREGGHHDDPHCSGCCRRSRQQWYRNESGTSDRERHRILLPLCRA